MSESPPLGEEREPTAEREPAAERQPAAEREPDDLGPARGRKPSGQGGTVVIAVVRMGGIAGISRRWQVEAEPAEAPQWIALIDQCPWDQTLNDQPGADRFVWSIRARTPSERREQDVPDSELSGPWRELVDAVRKAKG